MARPRKFERAQVIQAALVVARRKGLRELTARNVAKELGGSTSVIYGRFASIEALQEALVEQVIGGAMPGLAPRVQEEGLKVVVWGLCRLAEQEPWLLELVDAKAHPVWSQARQTLAMILGSMERFAHLDVDERLALISRVTMPAVGLAVAAATGELSDVDASYDAVVEPVIEHVLRTRPRDNLLAGRPVE
ncbi:MAG: AcrR family transcriptional regulator [Myxococcota bacterium]|jgi:AcrR family transcriptional regulator